MPTIGFCGQAYTDRTINANAQEAINLYPMVSPENGISGTRIIMYPTPGFSSIYDIVASSGISGVGAIRGLYVINDVLFVISGTKLIKITGTTSYTATSLGTLTTSSGRCSIQCNTVELAISDGSYGYVYNLNTTSFSTISGGSWPSNGITNFAFMDGYMLGAVNNSSRVIQSDSLAAGTYGAQAYVDVASYPDYNKAIFSDQLQLYILGPKLTEVRYDAGQIPFAFPKTSGVLIQVGCVSWSTIQKVGNTVIWLMSDAAGKSYIGALEGYSTKVLSTPPINEALERYSVISDAFAYTYREGDTQFYSITFPTEGVTWVLDVGTGWWHKRSVNNSRDLPDHYVLWQGMHVVGDSSGKLYQMSQDYLTDGSGNGLKRVRTCQYIEQDNNVVFIDELQIDIESGTSTSSTTEPLATLEASKDGGHTWYTLGSKGFGKMGQYNKRLLWMRLGYSRNGWVFRLTITDAVRPYIMGAFAKLRLGSR